MMAACLRGLAAQHLCFASSGEQSSLHGAACAVVVSCVVSADDARRVTSSRRLVQGALTAAVCGVLLLRGVLAGNKRGRCTKGSSKKRAEDRRRCEVSGHSVSLLVAVET